MSGKLQPAKAESTYKRIISQYGDMVKLLSVPLSDSLVLGIIAQESEGVQTAKGSSGEYGIFQIMPFHFKDTELNRFSLPTQSVVFTRVVRGIIAELTKRKQFSLDNFLAAYNAGVGGAMKGKSKDYALSVKRHAERIQKLRGVI